RDEALGSQAGAYRSLRSADVVYIAHIRKVSFVDAIRSESGGETNGSQLRTAQIQRAETGDIRTALKGWIGIRLRVIVSEIIGRQHSEARARVHSHGALVVAERLIHRRCGEVVIRQVGRGYILEQFLRRSRPYLL